MSDSSAENTSSTSASRATDCSLASAGPICAAFPCVTTAALVTGRGAFTDGGVDPAGDFIALCRLLAVNKMDEELSVPLRPGKTGVYDAGDARSQARGGLGHRAGTRLVHVLVADDAFGACARPASNCG